MYNDIIILCTHEYNTSSTLLTDRKTTEPLLMHYIVSSHCKVIDLPIPKNYNIMYNRCSPNKHQFNNIIIGLKKLYT